MPAIGANITGTKQKMMELTQKEYTIQQYSWQDIVAHQKEDEKKEMKSFTAINIMNASEID